MESPLEEMLNAFEEIISNNEKKLLLYNKIFSAYTKIILDCNIAISAYETIGDKNGVMKYQQIKEENIEKCKETLQEIEECKRETRELQEIIQTGNKNIRQRKPKQNIYVS